MTAVFHASPLRIAYQPVIIERRLFQVPDSTTMAIWMKKNSRNEKAQRKWMVRALCRPPNSHGKIGKAASMVGDSTTMAIWMKKNSRNEKAQRKWMVRALC